MQTLALNLRSLTFVAVLALASTGCIKKMLLDGQIESTLKASAAVQTFSDWEVAQRAASAGMSTAEGMHFLAPYNENALLLLTKGWSGLSFGFIEDEMEQAQDEHGEDSEQAEYHKARAVAAYVRAIYYGTKVLDMRNEGFDAAKKNVSTMRAWLKGFEDAEDAPYLLWTGQAWISRVNLLKDQPEVVADLFIAHQMIKRSVELDPKYNYATGHTILGAYHARSATAELDESKKHFDAALKINGGKALLTKLNLAAKYYCVKVDKANYVKLLTEVVEAGDVLPEQRLSNTIAKRRARRYLSKERMANCGF
ncbi:MAG: hypothetical protein JRI68_30250 [Deltaproteobacteria bacterium]|nr:hypothetical protein [Deltaproteobacteria bacterium]